MFWIRLIELILMILALLWSLAFGWWLWNDYLGRPLLLPDDQADPLWVGELSEGDVTLVYEYPPNRDTRSSSCKSTLVVWPLGDDSDDDNGWTVKHARNAKSVARVIRAVREMALGQWTDSVRRAELDLSEGSSQAPDECSYRFWADQRGQSRKWVEHSDLAEQIEDVEQSAAAALAVRIEDRIGKLYQAQWSRFELYGVGVSVTAQLLIFAAFSAVTRGRRRREYERERERDIEEEDEAGV